jgi:hypothetical protein
MITAVILFVFYLVFDILYAHYIIAMGESKAFKSANISAILIIMSLYGTIEVVKNYWFIIPIALGSWLGTYLTIKYSK